MPKNSIVRNEQTATKSSNKTAPSRATAGANKAGGAQVSQPQKNATARAQSHAQAMQEIEREYPRTQAPSIPDTDLDLSRTALAICEALECEAINFDVAGDGVLRMVFDLFSRSTQTRRGLIHDGVAMLTGADIVRGADVFMPMIFNFAREARYLHGEDKIGKDNYLLWDGRKYAFEFIGNCSWGRLELLIDAYAVTSDWLAENIADMFKRLAFEIDMGIAFVNARRERGYLNA